MFPLDIIERGLNGQSGEYFILCRIFNGSLFYACKKYMNCFLLSCISTDITGFTEDLVLPESDSEVDNTSIDLPNTLAIAGITHVYTCIVNVI